MGFNGIEAFIPEETKPYKPEKGQFIPNRFRGVNQVMPEENFSVNSGSDVKKYDTVSLNPVINTPLNAVLMGTFWGTWSIEGVNDYDIYPEFEELDRQLITMINDQIYDMKYETFENTLKAFTWDSMVYGFEIAEMNFTQRDGLNVVESIKTKPPFNFNIWVNQVDDIEKIQHTPSGTYIEGERLDKFVIGTYPYLRDGNHYGTSILKSVAFDVQLLEIMEEAQTRGVKMLSIRPVIHWEKDKDRTVEEINNIRNAIFNMESASVISLPMDLVPGNEEAGVQKSDQIQVLEDRASPDGVKLIIDIIDMLQKRITRNLGLPDDLGFTSTGVGSFAKSKTEMDMFLAFVTRNQQYIRDVVNRQIIPAMVKYNFSSFPDKYRLPQFMFESIEEDHMGAVSTSIDTLIKSGVIEPDEQWIRPMLGIPQKQEIEDNTNEVITITNSNKRKPSKMMKKIKGVLFGK